MRYRPRGSGLPEVLDKIHAIIQELVVLTLGVMWMLVLIGAMLLLSEV